MHLDLHTQKGIKNQWYAAYEVATFDFSQPSPIHAIPCTTLEFFLDNIDHVWSSSSVAQALHLVVTAVSDT